MINADSARRVFLALDDMVGFQALAITEKLKDHLAGVKVGSELFVQEGPEIVRLLAKITRVFLDLKFHDIPNTVEKAVKEAAETGAWMCNIHTSGGMAMMRAAINGANGKIKVIGVTVLTSLKSIDLKEVDGEFFNEGPGIEKLVLNRAVAAAGAGLYGVVASPLEPALIRKHVPAEFTITTPGIRPAETNADDQKRLATPRVAILNGSDWLVIGRPIYQAKDPLEALQKINEEVAAALAERGAVTT